MTGKWALAEAMSMLRSRVGVATLRNSLYAIGGYNGHDRLATVEVFDPVRKYWSQVTPMQSTRRLVAVVLTVDEQLKRYLFCYFI